jgi:hypothetical protein
MNWIPLTSDFKATKPTDKLNLSLILDLIDISIAFDHAYLKQLYNSFEISRGSALRGSILRCSSRMEEAFKSLRPPQSLIAFKKVTANPRKSELSIGTYLKRGCLCVLDYRVKLVNGITVKVETPRTSVAF